MRITTDISGAERALTQIEQRTLFAVESYGKAAGGKMVAYARRNRPWKDRSRAARDSISYQVLRENGQAVAGLTGGKNKSFVTRPIAVKGIIVGLTAGPYYSLYLETLIFRHAGRLSIWWPTVHAMQPEILRAWADRVKGG